MEFLHGEVRIARAPWQLEDRIVAERVVMGTASEALAKKAAGTDVKHPSPTTTAAPRSADTEPLKFKWFAHPLQLIDASY